MLTNTRTAVPLTRLLTRPLSHETLRDRLWTLTEQYPCCSLQTIGQSAGGRSLEAVSLGGEGDLPTLVYAGGFSPADWLSTAVLFRFLEEYAELLADNGRLYRVHLPGLYAHRRICVLPMVNPDAFDAPPDPAASTDYRNGAGADITSYFRGGTETQPVEKCPESTALRQYLRWLSPALFCVFGTGGETRLMIPSQPSSRAKTAGRLLSRMLSAEITGEGAPLSSIPTWYAAESGSPSYSVTIGDTGAEERFLAAYASLREMLFTAPLLL